MSSSAERFLAARRDGAPIPWREVLQADTAAAYAVQHAPSSRVLSVVALAGDRTDPVPPATTGAAVRSGCRGRSGRHQSHLRRVSVTPCLNPFP